MISGLSPLDRNAELSLAWSFHGLVGMLEMSLRVDVRVQKSNREILLALGVFDPKNGTFVTFCA